MILSILSGKGGSGKSTLAINLARAFQLGGRSVLLIDTDGKQSSSRDWSLVAGDPPFPVELTASPTALVETVPGIASRYDVVVIDGAAHLDPMDRAAIAVSDLVLIPTRHSLFDSWGAAELAEHIREAQAGTGRPIAAFVVVQSVSRSRIAGEIDEALDVHGLPVLKSRTGHRVAYIEAGSTGTTVFDMGSRAKEAAHEVQAIANETFQLWQRAKH